MNNNTVVLTGRLMKHILRSPDTIITVALTPIAMMLMFVYVFGGAVKMSMDADVNYINYQLPGILLMAIASGIAYTAFRLFMDMQKGLFSRFNSMPISRSSVLWSHVLASLVSNMLTVVIIILVALISAALPALSQFSFCADRNNAQSRPCFCGESACNVHRGDDTRFAELRTSRKRYLDSPRVVYRYHGCCLLIRDEGVSTQDMKTRSEGCT